MANQMKETLESALSIIIKYSARRHHALVKEAKAALTVLKELQVSDDDQAFLLFKLEEKEEKPVTKADEEAKAEQAEEDGESLEKVVSEVESGQSKSHEGGDVGEKDVTGTGDTGDSGEVKEEEIDVKNKADESTSTPEEPAPDNETANSTRKAYEDALAIICEAIKAKQVKVVNPLLTIMYEVFAQSNLRGIVISMEKSQDAQRKNLLSEIMEAVCSVHELGDENVEIGILSILLGILLCKSVGIHGEALLLLVRTCYQIFLGSRSEVVQLYSKACLIQTIIFIMEQVESTGDEISCIQVSDIASSKGSNPSRGLRPEESVQKFVDQAFSDMSHTVPLSDVNLKYSLDLIQDDTNPSEGESEVLDRASSRSIGTFSMISEEVTIPETLIRRKDVFLVFRALCKLSMKTGTDGAGDEFAIRGKILSLELIKVLLQNSGPIFQNHERYIDAVKQYLCLSLLKNCASTITPAFQLSASIFQTLTEKFRSSLKSQFGVFFPMIFLKPFDSPGFHVSKGGMSPYELYSQWVVLFRCLYTMCCDKQILSDIFVNYDCDLDESNLFERLVAGLVKLVQGAIPIENAGFSPTMEFNLKFFALQCLIGIVKSLNSEDSEGDVASGSNDEDDSNAGEEGIHVNGEDAEEPKETSSSQTEQLEQRKAYKTVFQKGILQYNKKPKKGIQFLQKQGMVGEGAEDVAKFLLSTQGLDKTSVGDYLGEADPFNLQVMHVYVEMLDFTNMAFDEGIRHFLSGFRLPGEAQKIDRLMEKFAERYCICNPSAFSQADTAYVLAYSIIMLNTDAHNPQVKAKMTLDGFVKNNRGIDDGNDLPGELLSKIYNNIVENEIKMKAESNDVEVQAKPKPTMTLTSLDTIRNIFGGSQAIQLEPDDETVRRTHQTMKERGSSTTWTTAVGNEDVRPMLEIVWAPLLGAISIAFEGTDDESITSLCMDGFYYVIKLAGPLGMETVRDAFLNSLAKATHLHVQYEKEKKRGLAFKTLLKVALDCGNHLSSGWKRVLTCISQFDYQQQLENGSITDENIFSTPSPKSSLSKSSPQKSARKTNGSQASSESMASAFGPSCMTDIALLFESSGNLNSSAIVDFVKELCAVSTQELENERSPRVFSLTKIIEVAHYNMNRVRIVWSRIWSLLSDFFIFVGCHPNLNVAMYSIDALRQLAMKFLERDELANYTFQNDFLKPFVIVMRQSRAVEIRELIIRCVSQFILARVANVKSGWKSMFMVFTAAASDESKQLVALAFETIEKIVREYFSHVTETETATFRDCVNCLIAFANSQLPDVALNAIAFLRFCALKLAEGELGELKAPAEALESLSIGNGEDGSNGAIPKVNGSPANQKTGTRGMLFTDKDVHVYFWFPLLAGLSELTFDTREQIRHSSLEVLFDTLNYHGSSFTTDFWVRIFSSILFPIFDHVRAEITETTTFVKASEKPVVDAWLYETCRDSLEHVVDLFAKFYTEIKLLLPEMSKFILGFITRNHENIASMGVDALLRLLLSIGDKLGKEELVSLLSDLESCVIDILPDISSLVDSLQCESGNPDTSSNEERQTTRSRGKSLTEGSGARKFAQVKCRASVQILLVKGIANFYQEKSTKMDNEIKQQMLHLLKVVFKHANAINTNTGDRAKLKMLQDTEALIKESKLPDPPLLELEMQSFHIFLSILMDITTNEIVDQELRAKVNKAIVEVCIGEITSFISLSQKFGAEEGSFRTSNLKDALQAMLALPEELFKQHVVSLFTHLSDLIKCDYALPEVLQIVSQIFTTRIVRYICEIPSKGE